MKTHTFQRFIGIIISLIISIHGVTQTRPRFHQQTVNQHLINPAVTGAYGYTHLQLSLRNQTKKLPGAPQALVLNGHTSFSLVKEATRALPTIGTRHYRTDETREAQQSFFKARQGIGALFYRDENEAYYRHLSYISYAMHFPVAAHHINVSIGASGGLVSLRKKSDQIGFFDNKSIIAPAFSAGALVYSHKFYGGFTIGQLSEADVMLPGVNDINQALTYYYLMGGYRWRLNKQWQIIPSVLVRMREARAANFSLAGRLVYQEKWWAGFNYQEGETLGVLAGLVLGRFELNYTYAYPLMEPTLQSINNHELALIYRWGISKEAFRHNLF